MKAVTIGNYGGEEVIEIQDTPLPRVNDNEVLVEVYSSCINPLDYKVMTGAMKPLLNYKFPLILGTDFSGKVIKIGKHVSRFSIGDEVCGSLDAKKMGAFSEYVAIEEKHISLKPKNLDFDQAASLPMVALTVTQAFNDIAQLSPGQKILIKAGSGGIGSYAIQYAKALGAEVATTVSAANSDLVRKLGADHVIDYRNQKLENILSNYDVVLNTVDAESLEASFAILKKGGHMISLVGPPDKKFAQSIGLNFIFQVICSVLGRKAHALARKTKTYYTFHFVKPSGKQLEGVKDLVEKGKIEPVIDRIFSIEQAREALAYVALGRSKGKVVLKIKSSK